MKAAIIAARQESAALSKDGKTLFSPVLPRLLLCLCETRNSNTRCAKGKLKN